MSGVNNNENKNIVQTTEAYLSERQAWMQDAMEAVGAERSADPLQVFPTPEEVRANSRGLELTTQQETALREVAGKFGIGGEVDVTNEANHQIIEGGKPWKIEAESAISKGAKTLLYAGSPYRKLGQDEIDYVKQKFGVDLADKSEYDMARLIAQQEAGFDSLEKDDVLPFGYDIHNKFALVPEATGQLVRIGTGNDYADVVLLRVDRENYVDDEGNNKYRNQPDSAALMSFVADVLTARGDETSSVGINTSNTYASRAIDVVRAGLQKERAFSVGMYGRQTLAHVKREPVAEPTPINQIPGELHTIYSKLQQLETELNG